MYILCYKNLCLVESAETACGVLFSRFSFLPICGAGIFEVRPLVDFFACVGKSWSNEHQLEISWGSATWTNIVLAPSPGHQLDVWYSGRIRVRISIVNAPNHFVHKRRFQLTQTHYHTFSGQKKQTSAGSRKTGFEVSILRWDSKAMYSPMTYPPSPGHEQMDASYSEESGQERASSQCAEQIVELSRDVASLFRNSNGVMFFDWKK